jgi:hypothetical protein
VDYGYYEEGGEVEAEDFNPLEGTTKINDETQNTTGNNFASNFYQTRKFTPGG